MRVTASPFSVSRRSPWELNHWKLGNGSPVTLQSISTQLPSRAIIWFTLVNTTGTNPPLAAVPFAAVPFPSASSDKVSAAQEARRDATSRSHAPRRRWPPEECIVTNCRCTVTPEGRDCHSSLLSIWENGYLSITEGSLVVGCVAGDMTLDRGREGEAEGKKDGKKKKQTCKQGRKWQTRMKQALWKKDRKIEINKQKQGRKGRNMQTKRAGQKRKQTNKEGKRKEIRNKHANRKRKKEKQQKKINIRMTKV